MILNFIKKQLDKKQQQEEERNSKILELEKEMKNYIDLVKRGANIKCDPGTLILQKGETCSYKVDAQRLINGTKSTYHRRHHGHSVRIAKGLYLNSGKSSGYSTKTKTTTKYNGILYITNKRIVFTSNEKPCTLKLSSIIEFKKYTDGIGFINGQTTYTFKINKYFIELVQAIIDKNLR